MNQIRKVAAILVSDVVGYSRLVGADEDRTLARLRALRSDMIDPTIAVHNGRVVKRTGDGAIVEFRSVIGAVRCAIEVQSGMVERNAGLPPDQRIEFRIGIHLGDVVEESDGDLMGDGVNIAARLEGIGEVGGVCLSEDAYRQVRDRIKEEFVDLGEQTLKNIARPMRAYQFRAGAGQTKPEPAVADPPSAELALPDKPSIAVLPFQNMSGDAEQDYFADGIVEDIITALSRARWLFVIARNSSFTYKGRAVDVKQVGRELGVRYVLEGSVRKAGNKVRITGQLIDASTGAHLWAERFDGGLEDIFDLQDQVTASVVGAIAPRLEQAEIERARRKPTESLDAYDYFLRGLAASRQWTKEGNNEALPLYYKAIELDPRFASAYGAAARCYTQRKSAGWVTDRAYETAEAERLARRAGELGGDDAVALAGAGMALAYVVADLEGAAALTDRALVLDPNLAVAWWVSGWINVFLGEPEAALECEARAMRLSPQDPQISNMQAATAAAHFFAGRYAEASSWAETAVQGQPNFLPSSYFAAASAALLGNTAAAEKAIARVLKLMPELRISRLGDVITLRRSQDMELFAEGMRKAGLPE
jgi:TolB-like protein/class 3 adenylate cyclase